MEKLKILIVDDMSSMRRIMREGLKRRFAGIQVDEAGDGAEAQEKLQERAYDLVLCDWVMPDISGDELLRWMRSHETLRGMPFIMVTSKGEKESILKAFKEGASDYIIKPFTIESLTQKIMKLVVRQQG